jgi:hypothetical protein
MARGDPKRTRTAVRHKSDHLGYLTTVGYPDRDITMFPEGSPYSEAVVSDLKDRHVALLQRFKAHWLVHCGPAYDTTAAAGDLTAAQLVALAVFALLHKDDPPPTLVAALKARVEQMLPSGRPA